MSAPWHLADQFSRRSDVRYCPKADMPGARLGDGCQLWIGSGFGNSEGKKGYGCVAVFSLVMTCFRRSGPTEMSPVNG